MSILCRKFGHKWSGCKCQRCGEVRDESHNWHGCTCIICGMTRDEQHKWNGCTCLSCGKVRDEHHDYKNGRCRRCGKALVAEEIAKEIRRLYSEWHGMNHSEWRGTKQVNVPCMKKRSVDSEVFDLVASVLMDLDERGRNEVCLAWLSALVLDDGWNNIDEWAFWFERNYPGLTPALRAADLSMMLRLYAVIQASPRSSDYMPMAIFRKISDHVKLNQTDPDQALEACREAGLDDAGTREFLWGIGVADGKLVTRCDIGKHDWEVLESEPDYGSGSGEDYDWGRGTIDSVRCRVCGLNATRYGDGSLHIKSKEIVSK